MLNFETCRPETYEKYDGNKLGTGHTLSYLVTLGRLPASSQFHCLDLLKWRVKKTKPTPRCRRGTK